MSRCPTWFRLAFFFGLAASLMLWLPVALCHDQALATMRFNAAIVYTLAVWSPFLAFAAVIAGKALHFRLRKPDIVITVTAQPTPLELKFQEQDRRLERRERLKGEVFKNECEIETFAAGLTPDERKAWQNRPGPYGK